MNNKTKNVHISSFKLMYFRLFTYILQNLSLTMFQQTVITLFQMIQIISLSFDEKFHKYWNNNQIISKLQFFSQCFRLNNFFKVKIGLYSFWFCLVCCFLIAYTVCTFLVCYFLKTPVQTKNHLQLIGIIKRTFHIYVHILYLPFLNTLLSITNCSNNVNNYVNSLKCNGGVYYCFLSFGIFLSIILFAYCFTAVGICYERFYQKNGNANHTSIVEVAAFILKTILVIVNEASNNAKVYIILYIISTILLSLSYCKFKDFYNHKKRKLNKFFCFVLLWHSFSLGLSASLEKYGFNCGFFLCAAGVVFGVIGTKIFIEVNYDTITDKPLDIPMEGALHIERLLDLVHDVLSHKRKAILSLYSYMYSFEKHCHSVNCPLLRIDKSRIDSEEYKAILNSLLLQHIENKYKSFVRKFPQSFEIKMLYLHFLYTVSKKPLLVESEFYSSLDDRDLTLNEEFLLFRLQCIVDQKLNHLTSQGENLNYLRLYNQLKEDILRISSLYVNFWNSLLVSHQQKENSVMNIDDCGNEITILKEQIFNSYKELQKIKPNDIKIMTCYAEFLEDILDDYVKGAELRRKIEDIRNELAHDNSYTSEIDLQRLQNTDKLQYLIIATSPNDFGTIVEVSLNFCVYSGYVKEEIIGKNHQMLIPPYLREVHEKMLQGKIDNLNDYQAIKENNKKKTPLKSYLSFFVSKSGYIKPAMFNPSIFTNEFDLKYFIVKISLEDMKIGQQFIEPIYMITDMKMMIMNYSINANRLLAMGSLAEVQKHNYYLNNFISNFEKSAQVIRWSKKFGKYNVNNEFYFACSNITISGQSLGYRIKLVPKLDPSSPNHFEKIDISQNFIPNIKNNLVFTLNTKDIGFVQKKYEESKKEESFVNDLKERAIAKISLMNKKTEISASNETSQSGSSYTEDEKSSFSEDDLSRESEEELAQSDKEGKAETKPEMPVQQFISESPKISRDEYYHVRVSNVKLFIYNYSTKIFDVIPQSISAVGQIESRFEKIKQANEVEFKPKENKKFNNNHSKQAQHSQIQTQQKNEESEKIIKQIKYSMSKNEAVNTIIKLKVAGLFAFAIKICEGVITYTLFMNVNSKLDETSLHMQYSYRLLMNLIIGVLYTRELTLIAITDYNIGNFNEEAYYNQNLEKLKTVTTQTQEYSDILIQSKVQLSKENEKKLNGLSLETYMVTDTLDVVKFQLDRNAVNSQVTSALFGVSTLTIDEIYPTRRVVYFAMTNGLNGLAKAMFTQADVMSDEYISVNQSNLKLFIYVMLAYFAIACILILLLIKYYSDVDSKKNQYLAVFEEIKIKTIIHCLDKCTNLNQRYSLVNEEEEKKSKLQNISESKSEIQDDTASVAIGENLVRKDSNTENVHQKKNSRTKNYKQKITVIVLLMLFSTFISIIIYAISAHYFDILDAEMEVYKTSSDLYVKIINYENLIREYMLDNTTFVNYLGIGERIKTNFDAAYTSLADVRHLMEGKMSKLPKEYLEKYDQVYYGSLCQYAEDSFLQKINNFKNLTCDTMSSGIGKLVNFFLTFRDLLQ